MSYQEVSFWLETCGDDLRPRPPLSTEATFDTVIVGGGFTGLWTAHALLEADPRRRVAILEREIVGFGPSGRNGGWASALFPVGLSALARRFGADVPRRVSDLLVRSVDDLGATASGLGVDAHFHKGGALTLATSEAQWQALPLEIEEAEKHGLRERFQLLNAEQVRSRLVIPPARGAIFDPHCAVIHPARLVRGLARSLEARGVRIFEGSGVTAVDKGGVTANGRAVRSPQVVLATESYTTQLPGLRRSVLPVYSLIILTEPIPEERWAEVGWAHREAITDGRHLLIYLQRTSDGRILFGGRGAPYHFGSAIRRRYDRHPRTFAHLRAEFDSIFPQLGGIRFTHAWGGPVAITRDWMPSVCYDAGAGLAWSRGYAGDGVTFSFLAGHTIADLLLGRSTERTDMPWVGHRPPLWEPEPLRLIGSRLVYWSFRRRDRKEERTGRRIERVSMGEYLSGRNR